MEADTSSRKRDELLGCRTNDTTGTHTMEGQLQHVKVPILQHWNPRTTPPEITIMQASINYDTGHRGGPYMAGNIL